MGKSIERDELVSLIYETVAGPDRWLVFLDTFSEAIGGHGAALRSYDVFGEVGSVISAGMEANALDRNFRHFAARNPLKTTVGDLRRKFASGSFYKPGIMRDIEWLPKEKFIRTDYYNEFYKEFDIHSDVSIGLELVGDRWTGIDVYRPKRHRPLTDDQMSLWVETGRAG